MANRGSVAITDKSKPRIGPNNTFVLTITLNCYVLVLILAFYNNFSITLKLRVFRQAVVWKDCVRQTVPVGGVLRKVVGGGGGVGESGGWPPHLHLVPLGTTTNRQTCSSYPFHIPLTTRLNPPLSLSLNHPIPSESLQLYCVFFMFQQILILVFLFFRVIRQSKHKIKELNKLLKIPTPVFPFWPLCLKDFVFWVSTMSKLSFILLNFCLFQNNFYKNI